MCVVLWRRRRPVRCCAFSHASMSLVNNKKYNYGSRRLPRQQYVPPWRLTCFFDYFLTRPQTHSLMYLEPRERVWRLQNVVAPLGEANRVVASVSTPRSRGRLEASQRLASVSPRSRGLAPQNPHFRPKGAENPCKY